MASGSKPLTVGRVARLSAHDCLLATGEDALRTPIGAWRGLNDLFLEGRLELFCETTAEVSNNLHMPKYRMTSADGVFGVSFDFPVALTAGEPHLVEIRYGVDAWHDQGGEPGALGPDIVVADGRVRWRRDHSGGGACRFVCRPQRFGLLRLALIKSAEICVKLGLDDAPAVAGEAQRGLDFDFDCFVTRLAEGDAEDLGPSPLRRDLRRWPSPQVYAEAEHHYRPVAWNPPPLTPPNYATDEVTIFGYHESIREIEESTARQAQLLRLYEGGAVNAMHRHLPELLEGWRRGDYCGVRTLFMGFPLVDHEHGGPSDLAATAKRVNELTGEFPNLRLVMRAAEPDTTQQWHLQRPPAVRAMIGAGRIGRRRDVMAAVCKANLDDFRARLVHPERVSVLFQMAGINGQGSDWYRYGCDIVLTKTIHRQCVNVVIASGRGAALPFGRAFGLEYDSWNGRFYHHNGVREPEFILMSLFFAGAQYFDNEYAHVGVAGERVALNAGGRHWLEFARFAARHPRRGRQRVRLAFVRGSEDMWFRPTAVGGNGHPGVTATLADEREWRWPDWSLLDVVYPKFGNVQRANHERFGTGTPFGPADIVPWDAPAEGLADYGVACLIGENNMTTRDLRRWTDYVQAGGTLVLALGSARRVDGASVRRAAPAAFERLTGVRIRRETALPVSGFDEIVPMRPRFYAQVALRGAETIESMPSGEPLLTRHRLGRGTVYFYTTDALVTLDAQSPRRLLRRLCGALCEVRFTPASDWLAYTVAQRDGIVLLSVINHGQARYPSDLGADTGPWEGVVQVDTAALGLSHFAEVLALGRDMHTRLLAAENGDGSVSFRARVDRWQEFVIGPAGQTRQLLFGPRH